MKVQKRVPKKGRGFVAKTPIVIQMEALECGAACLTMILAYCGRWVPLEQIREDCNVNRDGVDAKILFKVARSYGLDTHAYRCGIEALKERASFPCIIHWNFNHFVVLNGIRGNKAYLNDPAKGAYSVSLEDFERAFTGILFTFEPNESFQPGGKPKSLLEYTRDKLKGTGTVFIFVIITSVITTIINIINPGLTRLFLDELLTGKAPEWALIVLGGMILLALISITASLVNSIYNLRIRARMSAVGASSYMWKLLHLPMGFYSQRSIGDIQGRQSSSETISNTIVNTIAPLCLDAVLLVFYLVVILRYSVLLTFIGVGSMFITLALGRWASKRRMNINRVQQRDRGLLAGATTGGISMMETIKANGAETGFFGTWAGYQAAVTKQSAATAKTNAYIGSITSFVSSVTSTLVLMTGVFLVLNGEFTVGMVMAFQSYLAQFTGPTQRLVNAGNSLNEMTGQIERLDDVMHYHDDPLVVGGDRVKLDGKLKGDIEMRDVTFGYSKFNEPLIKNMNIHIQKGSKVAFVGFSGCGKSTVSKLLTGLCWPQKGQILYDGIPIEKIDRDIFTGSVAVVDQEIVLFEDSIEKNIKFYDDSIENFEMILAANDACIHDDISQRPNGYQNKLCENGSDLSGGQRQRIEIARALAQDPSIIVLDEATSALDALTEYKVVEAIRRRGITCVVIAHRLSTIRDCDCIYVLDKGKIVDSGTHDELYARGGLYTELISND